MFIPVRKPTVLLQAKPAHDLRLKIVGSARDGETLRIRSQKCTLGSAAGCTVRLRAAGVRPVMCLILRGALGTAVRAWGPGAKLNGHHFTTAPLAIGDRLQVGPIEFEVLAPVNPDRKLLDDASDTETLGGKPAVHGEIESHETHQRQARAARKLIQDVCAAWDEPGVQPRGKAFSAPPSEVKAQIDAARRHLERRRQALELAQDQWEATRRVQQLALDDRDRSLSREHAELEAARRAFEAEQLQWRQARNAGDQT